MLRSPFSLYFCLELSLLSTSIFTFLSLRFVPIISCHSVVLNIIKVDENMVRAQKRDAVRTGKFFFRKSVLPPGFISPVPSTPSSGSCSPVEWLNGIPPKERKLRNCFSRFPPPPILVDTAIEDEYEEMSMEEIFNGKVSTEPTCTALEIIRFIAGQCVSRTARTC